MYTKKTGIGHISVVLTLVRRRQQNQWFKPSLRQTGTFKAILGVHKTLFQVKNQHNQTKEYYIDTE